MMMGWGFVVGQAGQEPGQSGCRNGSQGTGPNLPEPLLSLSALPRGHSSTLGRAHKHKV